MVAPKRVDAEVVYRAMRAGRNGAVLLGARDQAGEPVDCVVKLPGLMENRSLHPLASLLEWLAAALATRLGLRSPVPYEVIIAPEFAAGIQDERIRDGARTSIGSVYGSGFVKGVQTVAGDLVDSSLRVPGAAVMAFDAFIHNVDRRVDNPNLFLTRSEFIVFDHGDAFSFVWPIVGGADPVVDPMLSMLERHALRSCVRRHGAPSSVATRQRTRQVAAYPRHPASTAECCGPMAAAGGSMDANVKLPFEAVAVHYVHDVRAEEFLNIGVIVFCEQRPFAGARFLAQWERITAAFPGADFVLLRRIASAFQRRCEQWSAEASGQQALVPVTNLAALLRSVMIPDDSSVQFSRVMSGVTADPDRTLAELFDTFAGAALARDEHASRDDNDVWRGFAEKNLRSPSLISRLERHVVRVPHYELSFDRAWKNGTWNVAQPISFDLREPRAIRDKATSWTGKILTVKPHDQQTNVYLLVGMPAKSGPAAIRTAANDALAILEDTVGGQAEVVPEDEGAKLANKIASDLAAHDDGR